MKSIFGKSKTILSEEGVGKVSIYEMDPHKSGKYQKLKLSVITYYVPT